MGQSQSGQSRKFPLLQCFKVSVIHAELSQHLHYNSLSPGEIVVTFVGQFVNGFIYAENNIVEMHDTAFCMETCTTSCRKLIFTPTEAKSPVQSVLILVFLPTNELAGQVEIVFFLFSYIR